MLSDLFGSSQRKDLLRIAAASPEDDLPAKILHKALRLHIDRGNLHRVENIDTSVEPFGDVVIDGTTGVEKGFPLGVGVHPVAQSLVMRFDHLGKKIRGDDFTSLGSGIVRSYTPGKTVRTDRLVIEFDLPDYGIYPAPHHIVGGLLFSHQHEKPLIECPLGNIVYQKGAQPNQRKACPPSENSLVRLLVEETTALRHEFELLIRDRVRRLKSMGIDPFGSHRRPGEVEIESVPGHAGKDFTGRVTHSPTPILLHGDIRIWRETDIQSAKKAFPDPLAGLLTDPLHITGVQRYDIDVQPL